MKKAVIIIFIIVLVMAIVFLGLNYYFHQSGVRMQEGWNDQKYYKILYMFATKNSLDVKYYFILDKEGKVIETRISESGDSDELTIEKNFINKFTPINFDVEIKDNSVIYSTTAFNGKTVDEVKSSFNNAKDSIIKNINFEEI